MGAPFNLQFLTTNRLKQPLTGKVPFSVQDCNITDITKEKREETLGMEWYPGETMLNSQIMDKAIAV